VLILTSTEIAIWWVAMTPLSIRPTKAVALLQAALFRELAEEPLVPGQTPPMPWRPRFVSGVIRSSPDPVHERIRQRVWRTVPIFLVEAAVLWIIAVNVASVVVLSRTALTVIQAVYIGSAAGYGFVVFRSPNGQATQRSWTVAIAGVAGVLLTLIPVGPH